MAQGKLEHSRDKSHVSLLPALPPCPVPSWYNCLGSVLGLLEGSRGSTGLMDIC